MRTVRLAVAIAGMLSLAACGQVADLKPVAGKTLPAAPYGREERLSAQEMTRPTTQAVPKRNVELRARSEERGDDPFDLPPAE